VSEKIARVVTGAPWLGLGAALVLLLGPNMLLIEMQAGRTIPLQLLLYALVLLGLLRGAGLSLAGAALTGFVAGLAALNRFDALLLPVPVALMIGWLTRSPAKGLAALAAAATAVSPWVAYSLTHFGSLFATDNAGIAASLDRRAFVTDWWPTPQPTFADYPLAWAGKVAANLGRLAHAAAGLVASPLGLTAAGFLAFPAALALLCRPARRWSAPLGVLAGFAVIAALMLAPQALTGYAEYRYFSALVWAGLLAASCWGIAQSGALHQRMIFAKGAAAAAVLAVAALCLVPAKPSDAPDFDEPADVRALQACLADAPKARVLVFGDDTLAARAGALRGITAMMAPRNMAEGRLDAAGARAFAARFGVTHVLAADPVWPAWIEATFAAAPAPGCGLKLYRLAR
jgi:hypothetical protein